jgi:hypothetical protein
VNGARISGSSLNSPMEVSQENDASWKLKALVPATASISRGYILMTVQRLQIS